MKNGTYLLCYDVRSPRRLQKVHRQCCKFGMPFQYSVFYIEASPGDLLTILERLGDIIDHDQDDVRVYRIGSQKSITWLGQGTLPGEVLLL